MRRKGKVSSLLSVRTPEMKEGMRTRSAQTSSMSEGRIRRRTRSSTREEVGDENNFDVNSKAEMPARSALEHLSKPKANRKRKRKAPERFTYGDGDEEEDGEESAQEESEGSQASGESENSNSDEEEDIVAEVEDSSDDFEESERVTRASRRSRRVDSWECKPSMSTRSHRRQRETEYVERSVSRSRRNRKQTVFFQAGVEGNDKPKRRRKSRRNLEMEVEANNFRQPIRRRRTPYALRGTIESDPEEDDSEVDSAGPLRRSHRNRRKAQGPYSQYLVDDTEAQGLRRSNRIRREVKAPYADYLEEKNRGKGSDSNLRRSTRATSQTSRPAHKRRRTAHSYGGHDDEDENESDNSSDSSEAAFDKREARRLDRERAKIRPINLEMHELSSLQLNGYKSGKDAPADIDPANLDTKIDFDSIGGLESHICALKEMVTLPLLYPKIFTKFNITPPRGVIFHGPPGTGKTLVARALASTCSKYGQKVSFFMRKGADCLSKWVGEAERQLRLLFEQARRMQPSIIFFDEIDGLAPVRSSRQDHIHSSIVSTLLALMDGLDGRGQVIVIGATNRIDAIDPALRRPGRFDRELRFGLPNVRSRLKILEIHSRKWNPKPSSELLSDLATQSSGYCGADLKALCTEASLEAVRRIYPEVYNSASALNIDVKKIIVQRCDFRKAMEKIVPSSKRSKLTYAKALPTHMRILLEEKLKDVVNGFTDERKNEGIRGFKLKKGMRVLVHGKESMGQSLIGQAVLQELESFPSYSIDLPTLLSDMNSRSAEEALSRVFTECRAHAPAIIYWPHIDLWWETAPVSLRSSIQILLDDLPVSTPVSVVALSDSQLKELPQELVKIFEPKFSSLHEATSASDERRLEFFLQILEEATKPVRRQIAPVQPESKRENTFPRMSNEVKTKAIEENSSMRSKSSESESDIVMCKLRMFLRGVVDRLMKYFKIFIEPVRAPDYRRTVLNPICLLDIRDKVNEKYYWTVSQFLTDIDLLVSNEKEHIFPDKKENRDRINKACHLQDSAFAMACQFPRKLEQKCRMIYEEEKKRKDSRDVKTITIERNSASIEDNELNKETIQSPEKSEDKNKEQLEKDVKVNETENGSSEPFDNDEDKAIDEETKARTADDPMVLPTENLTEDPIELTGNSPSLNDTEMNVEDSAEKKVNGTIEVTSGTTTEAATKIHSEIADHDEKVVSKYFDQKSDSSDVNPEQAEKAEEVVESNSSPAVEIEEVSAQVDIEKIRSLLQHISDLTRGWDMRELETLFLRLMQKAGGYREKVNRDKLPEDLQSVIDCAF